MRVLVTGGAGYIGSTVVECLLARGDTVVVLDNLSTGHRDAVHSSARFIAGDIRDQKQVETVLKNERLEAVIHLAALSLVGESMENPSIYYHNNVGGTLSLVEAMRSAGVLKMVFSSSAAVFGEVERMPITEETQMDPTSPYGATKLAVEHALRWYRRYGFQFGILRYFNAAGATPDHGEDHRPETHLVPRILRTALRGEAFFVHGTDYPTRDGSCIRDYVHVKDLADAHLRCLDALDKGSCTYNLGCGGEGFSVLEVLEAARRITGRPIPASFGPRRAGDPAALIASSERIRRELGWKPLHNNLEDIIGSAWAWMQKHPDGYAM